jgi:hypothetical protein
MEEREFKVELDVTHGFEQFGEVEQISFLDGIRMELLAKGIDIQRVTILQAVGPGGGWPIVEFRSRTREAIERYITEIYNPFPVGQPEYECSLIEVVADNERQLTGA